MRILCAGPEYSGTRMLTALLAKTGAEVVHSSPAYKSWEIPGRYAYAQCNYDAVVLIIRNGSWNVLSLVERGRFRSEYHHTPHNQIVDDIHRVLDSFAGYWEKVHLVTYESLVYETEPCVTALCEELGLPTPDEFDEIKNGNEKFWSPFTGWDGDDRDLTERL